MACLSRTICRERAASFLHRARCRCIGECSRVKSLPSEKSRFDAECLAVVKVAVGILSKSGFQSDRVWNTNVLTTCEIASRFK